MWVCSLHHIRKRHHPLDNYDTVNILKLNPDALNLYLKGFEFEVANGYHHDLTSSLFLLHNIARKIISLTETAIKISGKSSRPDQEQEKQ